MNELFTGKGPRITIIGGGTGLSVVLRGLKKITDNLAAVVTMADDGGSSGMLREDLGMLPPGDIRSCLLAMADDEIEDDFESLMQYRFDEGTLKGQNMGNLIIAGLAKMTGSFEKGLELAHDIFRIRGRVIPVTCEEITLCARLDTGVIVRGESNIPKTVLAGEGHIETVYLEPENVRTLESARIAIQSADIIVIGRFANAYALASVGVAASATAPFVNFLNHVTMGVTVNAAMAIGARDPQRCGRRSMPPSALESHSAFSRWP